MDPIIIKIKRCDYEAFDSSTAVDTTLKDGELLVTRNIVITDGPQSGESYPSRDLYVGVYNATLPRVQLSGESQGFSLYYLSYAIRRLSDIVNNLFTSISPTGSIVTNNIEKIIQIFSYLPNSSVTPAFLVTRKNANNDDYVFYWTRVFKNLVINPNLGDTTFNSNSCYTILGIDDVTTVGNVDIDAIRLSNIKTTVSNRSIRVNHIYDVSNFSYIVFNDAFNLRGNNNVNVYFNRVDSTTIGNSNIYVVYLKGNTSTKTNSPLLNLCNLSYLKFNNDTTLHSISQTEVKNDFNLFLFDNVNVSVDNAASINLIKYKDSDFSSKSGFGLFSLDNVTLNTDGSDYFNVIDIKNTTQRKPFSLLKVWVDSTNKSSKLGYNNGQSSIIDIMNTDIYGDLFFNSLKNSNLATNDSKILTFNLLNNVTLGKYQSKLTYIKNVKGNSNSDFSIIEYDNSDLNTTNFSNFRLLKSNNLTTINAKLIQFTSDRTNDTTNIKESLTLLNLENIGVKRLCLFDITNVSSAKGPSIFNLDTYYVTDTTGFSFVNIKNLTVKSNVALNFVSNLQKTSDDSTRTINLYYNSYRTEDITSGSGYRHIDSVYGFYSDGIGTSDVALNNALYLCGVYNIKLPQIKIFDASNVIITDETSSFINLSDITYDFTNLVNYLLRYSKINNPAFNSNSFIINAVENSSLNKLTMSHVKDMIINELAGFAIYSSTLNGVSSLIDVKNVTTGDNGSLRVIYLWNIKRSSGDNKVSNVVISGNYNIFAKDFYSLKIDADKTSKTSIDNLVINSLINSDDATSDSTLGNFSIGKRFYGFNVVNLNARDVSGVIDSTANFCFNRMLYGTDNIDIKANLKTPSRYVCGDFWFGVVASINTKYRLHGLSFYAPYSDINSAFTYHAGDFYGINLENIKLQKGRGISSDITSTGIMRLLSVIYNQKSDTTGIVEAIEGLRIKNPRVDDYISAVFVDGGVTSKNQTKNAYSFRLLTMHNFYAKWMTLLGVNAPTYVGSDGTRYIPVCQDGDFFVFGSNGLTVGGNGRIRLIELYYDTFKKLDVTSNECTLFCVENGKFGSVNAMSLYNTVVGTNIRGTLLSRASAEYLYSTSILDSTLKYVTGMHIDRSTKITGNLVGIDVGDFYDNTKVCGTINGFNGISVHFENITKETRGIVFRDVTFRDVFNGIAITNSFFNIPSDRTDLSYPVSFLYASALSTTRSICITTLFDVKINNAIFNFAFRQSSCTNLYGIALLGYEDATCSITSSIMGIYTQYTTAAGFYLTRMENSNIIGSLYGVFLTDSTASNIYGIHLYQSKASNFFLARIIHNSNITGFVEGIYMRNSKAGYFRLSELVDSTIDYSLRVVDFKNSEAKEMYLFAIDQTSKLPETICVTRIWLPPNPDNTLERDTTIYLTNFINYTNYLQKIKLGIVGFLPDTSNPRPGHWYMDGNGYVRIAR